MVATNSTIDTRNIGVPTLGAWSQAVLLLLIAVAAYFQTWVDIWPYWANKNATYTHGTLIAVVAGWLAWRTQPAVNVIEPKPSLGALSVVVVISAIWLLAEKANVFIVYAILWPVLAFVALWAGLGSRVASRFAFPLAFLYFAIPIWDYLKPPLQAITSTMASLLTSIFGIPAAFDGPYATLPTGTIFIAEDCSGAHFLAVALAVGVLAGVLRRDNLRTRLMILVIAGVLSMAFNWLRILLIVLAYLHPDLKHAFETMGHLTFGWWVFALDLIVFGIVLRFVPRSGTEQSTQPQSDQSVFPRRNSTAGMWKSAIALVLLPTIAGLLPRIDNYPTPNPEANVHVITTENEFVTPDLRWEPHFPGTAWEQRMAYTDGGGAEIEIYINRYYEQSQGNELISRGSHLFDPMLFEQKSSSIVSMQDAKGQTIAAHRDILADSMNTLWLTYFTYFVDDKPIVNRRHVQMSTALRSMYSRTTAGIVAIATPCPQECDPQTAAAKDAFLRAVEDYREATFE